MRLFTTNDYPAVLAVHNASWPSYPITLEQLRMHDQLARQHPEASFQRYVVEHNGKMIAFGHYDQPPRFYEPGRFRINIFVAPQHQRRGVGTSLYQRIVKELRELHGQTGQTVWTKIREDMLNSVQFVRKYDFYEELRIWESRLEITTFDSKPYAKLNLALKAQKIEIKTLQELASDPQRDQKLYDLTKEVGQDLPPTEHWTPPSYDIFKQDLSARSPESYFVALCEDKYIGLSYLTGRPEGQYCATGLTGIKRAYRRQGIALALKLRGIAYAKQQGYATIRTNVDSSNQASLAMNERLGFVKQPAWIVFAKEI